MMSAGKSIGGTVLLICFGLAAMFGGEKWLVALIPAAMLVWYGLDRPCGGAGVDGRERIEEDPHAI